MDGAGDQLLAGSGLAEDEHGRVGAGDARDLIEHALQRRRRSDDLLEHRRAVDLVAQRLVLVAHAQLGALALFDVGAGRVPVHHATFSVAQRVVLNEEPAVLPIVAPRPPFKAERHAARERLLPFVLEPLDVLGMKDQLARIVVGDLVDRQAVIVERGAVRGERRAIRVEHDDLQRNRIDNALRLRFGVLAIFDLGVRAVPGDDGALVVARGLGAAEEPAVAAVESAQARLDLTAAA